MNELEKLKAAHAELQRKYDELLNRHVLQMWATSELLIARRQPIAQGVH